jgi:endoglucanase
MNELLQQLSEAVGVSGAEKEVRLLLRDLIAPHVDSWSVDAMGNLLAVKKGTGADDRRVLVDAHMDEVGMMITSFESDGTLGFRPVGGLDPRVLLGKVVQVGPQKITGVIGARPVHLLTAEQYKRIDKIENMRIDIGAAKMEQAENKVKLGQRATFLSHYQEQGAVAMGKAFDDRAGCAALVMLLQGDPFPFDLHAVFSSQEEVGLRGAGVAAYSVNPHAALVLECTPAYDLPHDRDESPNVALGRGPAVYVMDSRTIQDPRFVAHIMRTAEAQGIPYQVRQPGGGGTNAGGIQRIHGGIPTATIATPGRHIHGPLSIINLDDFHHVVQLADAVLRGLTADLFNRE